MMKQSQLMVLIVILAAVAVAAGCVTIARDVALSETEIIQQLSKLPVQQGFARVHTTLQHSTMDMRIGYPAIIAPGGEYPSIKVLSLDAGTIAAEIISEESGRVMHQTDPELLGANENTTITFPGIPDEGRYMLRFVLSDGDKPIFQDTYYFTVMDVGQLPRHYSVVVHPGEDGRLVYTPDYRGNRIPDFSMVGYRGGMDLPTVPVSLELQPQPGDDTERIQAAIDAVSAMPVDEHGFRGAVLLKRGVYEISGTLLIRASGVVLRGEGQGDLKDFWLDPALGLTLNGFRESLADKDATILIATGPERRWVIRVEGSGGVVGAHDTATEIVDNYVPVGATSFTVLNAGHFSVGDNIIVERRGNEQWISEIGMNSIPTRSDAGNTNQWMPFNLRFEYVITGIDGNRISINSTIVNAIERRWGGGQIVKYTDPGRISDSGVENLRAISFWKMNEDGVDDTRHADRFLLFDNIRDGWARNITAEHFYGNGTFVTGNNSLGVSIKESSNLVAAREFYAGPGYDRTGRTFFETGVYTGRYGFHFAGQHGLVMDSYAINNRHAFVVSARVTGPNVFLNSYAEQSLTWSEPHHRWSVAGLYDNVSDMIALMNRLSYGSGHGWAGVNYVAWNTEGILVSEQPPTAQNWAIGHVGEKRNGPFYTWNRRKFGASHGYWESHGAHVEPASLYLKQREDRLNSTEMAH